MRKTNSMYTGTGLALAWAALTWLAPAAAVADERKYETPVGTVVIDVDSGWRPTDQVPEGLSGISFEVGSGGRTMNVMLAAVDDLSDSRIDAASVRKLAEDWRKEEATDGKTATEVRTFAGTHANGFVFQIAGAPGAKPGPGEYTSMIAGLLVTESAPLMFTIAWNDGGKGAADLAFAAVKRLRIVSR